MALDLEPLGSSSRADEVFERLRSRIFSAAFEPGEQLPGEREAQGGQAPGNRFVAPDLEHLDALLGRDLPPQDPAVDFDSRLRHAEVGGVEADLRSRTIECEVDCDLSAEGAAALRVHLDVEVYAARANARIESVFRLRRLSPCGQGRFRL